MSPVRENTYRRPFCEREQFGSVTKGFTRSQKNTNAPSRASQLERDFSIVACFSENELRRPREPETTLTGFSLNVSKIRLGSDFHFWAACMSRRVCLRGAVSVPKQQPRWRRPRACGAVASAAPSTLTGVTGSSAFCACTSNSVGAALSVSGTSVSKMDAPNKNPVNRAGLSAMLLEMAAILSGIIVHIQKVASSRKEAR